MHALLTTSAVLLLVGARASDPCDCKPSGCPATPAEGCKPAKDVLWLPLGDSITWGCNSPTIQDCHDDSASYRVPLALALSQHPLGPSSGTGFNISTMGTLETGPPYVPRQWLKHEGHPGWTIPKIDGILNQSLATSARSPDLVTIHLGTNDCNGNHLPSRMKADMDSLLEHIFEAAPKAQVFLADVIATGFPWNACILEYNKLVPAIVAAHAARGMKVFFVPVYAAMQPGCGGTGAEHDLCGGHQIHPTSAGYPRMASAYALKIMQNFTISE